MKRSKESRRIRLPVLAVKRQEALYARLPSLECKRLCSAYCGPIPVTELEYERLSARAGFLPDLGSPERVKKGDLTCPLLAQNECSVYAVRPLICRLWGLKAAKGKFSVRHFPGPRPFAPVIAYTDQKKLVKIPDEIPWHRLRWVPPHGRGSVMAICQGCEDRESPSWKDYRLPVSVETFSRVELRRLAWRTRRGRVVLFWVGQCNRCLSGSWLAVTEEE